jgi:hypothetical protein
MALPRSNLSSRREINFLISPPWRGKGRVVVRLLQVAIVKTLNLMVRDQESGPEVHL